MAKANRNDPCPCGSGKKYKKCCMLEERNLSAIRAGNREVVQEAVTWITRQHGDALAKWVEDVWFVDLSEDERKGIATADPAIKSVHDTNLLEYLVAEGVFAQDESDTPVLQLILNAVLNLEAAQRTCLEQLGQNPLHLYRVTDCDPGEGFDLQLYPVADGDTIYNIEDKWVSRMFDVDDIVGLRLMQTGGSWETSGAVYHIPDAYIDDLVIQFEADDDTYSRILIRYWLGLVGAHV